MSPWPTTSRPGSASCSPTTTCRSWSDILRTDGCVLGLSDAGAHHSGMCDASLPVDFLANWVRDRDLMPIEQGVRKVSGELADFIGLTDRGYLEVGQAADIVVFDLDDLDPGPLHRVHDFPADSDRLTADAPRGLRHVLVNGAGIRIDGDDVRAKLDTLPGQMLATDRAAQHLAGALGGGGAGRPQAAAFQHE